jgi:hypothetical protein
MITSAEQFIAAIENGAYAATDSIPDAVLLDVCKRFPDYKENVILNKLVPLSILEMLVTDPDARVRGFVAMKRKLPRALFELLVKDQDEGVRYTAACNRSIPMDILVDLCDDVSEHVSSNARERLHYRQTGRGAGSDRTEP